MEICGASRVFYDKLLGLRHGDGEHIGDFYLPLVVRKANLERVTAKGIGRAETACAAAMDVVIRFGILDGVV